MSRAIRREFAAGKDRAMSGGKKNLGQFCDRYLRADEALRAASRALDDAAHARRAARDALLAGMYQCGVEATIHDHQLVRLTRPPGGMHDVVIVVEPIERSYLLELPSDDEPDDAEVSEDVEALKAEFAAAEAVSDEGDAPWSDFNPANIFEADEDDNEDEEPFEGIGSEPGDDDLSRARGLNWDYESLKAKIVEAALAYREAVGEKDHGEYGDSNHLMHLFAHVGACRITREKGDISYYVWTLDPIEEHKVTIEDIDQEVKS
jgi:hypothetical protein